MELNINGFKCKLENGELQDDKIICAVFSYIDKDEIVYYVARYSDPYCGKRSKNILDALNSAETAEQIKQYILSLKIEENEAV